MFFYHTLQVLAIFSPKELNLVTFFLQASEEMERYLTYVLFIAVTISC